MNQRENRSNRTNPASNAEKPETKKATNTGARCERQIFACNKCRFSAEKEEFFKEHMVVHSYSCKHCKECFKTKGLEASYGLTDT